jgi:exosortase A-associated hydrolase 2
MATPFFLDASGRQLFCVYYEPDAKFREEAILYLPPFAEEMNKARRTVALQARRLSALGCGVLCLDLTGCGDSSGDHGDARWELWKEDLKVGVDWLKSQAFTKCHLWGLRLGALLALDSALENPHAFDKLVLWQPPPRGETLMTQFLRLQLAATMSTGQKTTTRALRERLAAGEPVEVGGYELHPALVAAIDALHLVSLAPPRDNETHWIEVAPGEEPAISPASAAVVGEWTKRGCHLQVEAVAGDAFWAATEITECPNAMEATTRIFRRDDL